MIQYWYFTGDASNNAAVRQGMYFQRGDDDYFPANYSSYLTNEGQAAWAQAAMTAAELEFPMSASMPSWVTLAENVWNQQVLRWDTESCGGGLRWAIFPYQLGYAFKDALSNGLLFQLSARLARYTGNQTYANWAEKIWDWSGNSSLLNTEDWWVGNHVDMNNDCKPYYIPWSYNFATYIRGAADMYNLVSQGGNFFG